MSGTPAGSPTTGGFCKTPSEDARRPGRPSKRRAARPVRAVREEREISLRELEELTGINRAVWSQIETGQKLPGPEHIAALSTALDVPAERWRLRFVLELEEPA